MTEALTVTTAYSGAQGSARWRGATVTDGAAFRRYMRSRVSARVHDTAHRAGVEDALRGLASTSMETAFVESFLKAAPPINSWEIGEALAECVLADDATVKACWPWNSARDRRTPRASLPGADLVGFCRVGDEVLLLFGEVKTSSDPATPPGVMTGRTGMTTQLERLATDGGLQFALVNWLFARCQDPVHEDLFRLASERFIASSGRALVVAGVLVRDTQPNALDLQSRAASLAATINAGGGGAGTVDANTRVELIALYAPIPINDWPELVSPVLP